jgi:hypothetical protein
MPWAMSCSFATRTGKCKFMPFESKPDGSSSTRRYNRHELSSAIAGFLEKQLRDEHPGETAFLLLWRRDGRLRPTFVDSGGTGGRCRCSHRWTPPRAASRGSKD